MSIINILKDERPEKLQILLTHRDPDSIVCAYLLQKILMKIFSLKAEVFIGYEPYHKQCKRIIDIVGFNDFKPLDLIDINVVTFCPDADPYHDSRLPDGFKIPKTLVTVDHHHSSYSYGEHPNKYTCNDCDFGACTTIFLILAEIYGIYINPIAAACICMAIKIDCGNSPSGADLIFYSRYMQMAHNETFQELNNFSVDITYLLPQVVFVSYTAPFYCFHVKRPLCDHEALLLSEIARLFYARYRKPIIVSGITRIHGEYKTLIRARSPKDLNLDQWLKNTFGVRAGARLVTGSDDNLPAVKEENLPLPFSKRKKNNHLKWHSLEMVWIGGTITSAKHLAT